LSLVVSRRLVVSSSLVSSSLVSSSRRILVSSTSINSINLIH
jgi:hypothetical protein